MIRYIVLILLIILGILFLMNIILNKVIKIFLRSNSSVKPKAKKPDEVIYNKEDIIVLKGEAKQSDNNEK